MKKTLLLFIVLSTLIYGCEQKRNEFKIYPLSPFNDVVKFSHDEDISKEMGSGLRTQYYIVDEDVDYSEKGKIRLQNFIETNLKGDVGSYKAIYFTFYKGNLTWSNSSVQTKQQLHDDHAKDKIAEFEYKDGKLYNFDFYKDGTYYDPPPENNSNN